ncbi:MAG: IS66 family insertion sequence element accessory protein TnpB [Roseovarius sp.]|nr:IS66 family insertion sequence element accessory protein TnpB [Roseovarius sp.]
MIAFPPGVKVWIAGGVTDMRRGMNTLALQVQEGLGRDPHAGEIFCFRGRRGDLVKILWHDGVGMSLYLKRLEAGKFIWPSTGSGEAVQISAAQLGYLLEGEEGSGNSPVDCFPRRKAGAIRAGPNALQRQDKSASPSLFPMGLCGSAW